VLRHICLPTDARRKLHQSTGPFDRNSRKRSFASRTSCLDIEVSRRRAAEKTASLRR
jgi:hypothetical protein